MLDDDINEVDDEVAAPPMGTVPASEYDALIDVLTFIVNEYTQENPAEAVDLIDRELGEDTAEFVRRILIDGDTASEIFSR
jgi:hypothetical protein